MLNTSHSFPSLPPQTTFVSPLFPFHLLFSTGLGHAWAFSFGVNFTLLYPLPIPTLSLSRYFSIYLSVTGGSCIAGRGQTQTIMDASDSLYRLSCLLSLIALTQMRHPCTINLNAF